MLVKRLETIFPVEILLRELNAPDPNRNFQKYIFENDHKFPTTTIKSKSSSNSINLKLSIPKLHLSNDNPLSSVRYKCTLYFVA